MLFRSIGASLSALWILVANAWMQYPVGMDFNPAEMRNVMDDFFAVALSPVAINKFCHTVTSGWTLAAVFVIGVSSWMLLKKRNAEASTKSIKVAGWVGLVGILATLYFGDGSAKAVADVQPMKLAAMEGLYEGKCGQAIVAFGIPNPEKRFDNDKEEFLFDISIPQGLSILAERKLDAFVPGVTDLVNGIALNQKGDTIRKGSYAERIARGKEAHLALKAYEIAKSKGNRVAMDSAHKIGRAHV